MRRLLGFVIFGLFVVAVGVAIAAAYFSVTDDGPASVVGEGTPTSNATNPGAPTVDPCTTQPVPSNLQTRIPPPDGRPRAVIIDEAALTAPNPTFVETATALLQQAGYTVDYYASGDVTVDLFSGLANKGYGFIIFRGHSAALFDDLILFTEEPYDPDKHVDEQRSGRLVEVHWNANCESEPRHFGIVPKFIESIDGDFNGATVLITGCWGIEPDSMAAAFSKKGAGTIVGWDGLVRADHTDNSTQRMLELLLIERLPAAAAVSQTASELGPDPDHGSELRLYVPDS